MPGINATNTDLVSTIADAFFTWFQADILPVCTAIFDILVIIVGFILNILLLVTFRKRGLFNETSSYLVLMLSVTDYISYVFLLIPNVISAIAKDWILSQPVCEVHGSMLFYLMFLNFAFVTVLSVERGFKLCRQDPELYEKIFESERIRNIIIALVWGFAAVLSFIPMTGAANIRFDTFHYGCMLDYDKDPAFLIFHFLFTVVMSTVVIIVSYSYIFNTRRNMLIKSRKENTGKGNSKNTGKGRNTITSNISGNSLPTISETDDDVFNTEKKSEVLEKKQNHASVKKQSKKRPKSTRRQSLLFEVFSDDEENPAFHLAMTYIFLWGTIMVCYIPYVCVSFYGAFNDGPLWGGFYSVTQLIMHTCYVVKPIVYLGHNRHYRQVTKQTIPEGIRTRARSMRTSVSSMTETLDDFLFRSNAQTKFRKALSTQKAVLIWKKRWQTKKGVFKLKDENNSLPIVPASTNGQTTENNNEMKATKQETELSHLATQVTPSVTPSGVLIQSTPTSSYIDQQRQKLLGMHSSSVQAGSLDKKGVGNNNNVSPVPGMVDEQLANV